MVCSELLSENREREERENKQSKIIEKLSCSFILKRINYNYIKSNNYKNKNYNYIKSNKSYVLSFLKEYSIPYFI